MIKYQFESEAKFREVFRWPISGLHLYSNLITINIKTLFVIMHLFKYFKFYLINCAFNWPSDICDWKFEISIKIKSRNFTQVSPNDQIRKLNRFGLGQKLVYVAKRPIKLKTGTFWKLNDVIKAIKPIEDPSVQHISSTQGPLLFSRYQFNTKKRQFNTKKARLYRAIF